MRWWPVFLRNLRVWRQLAIPSLVGNIAEPLMWLVAFGYGLGSLVGQVRLGEDTVPYLLFLASGSVCMSAMNAATFEALYSAFSRMHVQKTWDGILNTPIRLSDIVLAEMLWAAFKSLFAVTAILGPWAGGFFTDNFSWRWAFFVFQAVQTVDNLVHKNGKVLDLVAC